MAITLNNTKQEIFDAYNEVKQDLEAAGGELDAKDILLAARKVIASEFPNRKPILRILTLLAGKL